MTLDLHFKCTDVISRIFYFGIDQIRTPIQAFNRWPKYFKYYIFIPVLFNVKNYWFYWIEFICYSESKYIVSKSFLRVTFDAYAS